MLRRPPGSVDSVPTNVMVMIVRKCLSSPRQVGYFPRPYESPTIWPDYYVISDGNTNWHKPILIKLFISTKRVRLMSWSYTMAMKYRLQSTPYVLWSTGHEIQSMKWLILRSNHQPFFDRASHSSLMLVRNNVVNCLRLSSKSCANVARLHRLWLEKDEK